jgi:hypothetical protein
MRRRETAIEELATMLVGITADGRRILQNGDEETSKPTYQEAGLVELGDRKRLVAKRTKVRDLLAMMVGVGIEPSRDEEDEIHLTHDELLLLRAVSGSKEWSGFRQRFNQEPTRWDGPVKAIAAMGLTPKGSFGLTDKGRYILGQYGNAEFQLCSICEEPQRLSSGGLVCRNGHGGAPSKS